MRTRSFYALLALVAALLAWPGAAGADPVIVPPNPAGAGPPLVKAPKDPAKPERPQRIVPPSPGLGGPRLCDVTGQPCPNGLGAPLRLSPVECPPPRINCEAQNPYVLGPTMPKPPEPFKGRKGSGDTKSDQLFGRSPLCDVKSNGMKLEAGGIAQRNCRWSGSIAQPHPTANYGLDKHIDDAADPNTFIPSILQSLCQLIWIVLIYAVRSALLLLELGFSNDLVNGAMAQIKGGLAHLNDIFGTESWHLAAISSLGLWGIWSGLVRRKTIQTVGGLAVAVGLMIAVQVIMIRPEATVGHVAKLSNDGALVALSGASTGTVDNPADSFGKASAQLFDTLVVRPWCALQFTSVEGCLKVQKHKGQPAGSIADVWLSFPANSKERTALYDHRDGEKFELETSSEDCEPGTLNNIAANVPLLEYANDLSLWICDGIFGTDSKGEIELTYDDDKAGIHTDTSIQGEDGAFTRLAMLGMIGLGLIAAICVLFWLGIRLLLAGVFSLVLILFAPVVFLMAAFGEAGRNGVLAWGKKLFGLLVGEFIIAVLLAVIVLADNVINSLPMSWYAQWMLHFAFWGGLLLNKHELLGFFALDRRTVENAGGLVSGNQGTSLSSLYYGFQMARSGIRAAMAPARTAVNAGRDHAARASAQGADKAAEMQDRQNQARDEAIERQTDDHTAQSTAIGEPDRGELVAEAQRAHDTKRARDLGRARTILGNRHRTAKELHANRQMQRTITDELDGPTPPPPGRRQQLEKDLAGLQRREQGITARDSWAKDTVRRSVDEPRKITDRDVDSYIASRRQEVTLPSYHEDNLMAAGINPDTYRRASADEKQRLRGQSAAAMARSRATIETVSSRETLNRKQRKAAWSRIDAGPGRASARAHADQELRVVHRDSARQRAVRDREDSRRTRENDRNQRANRRKDEVMDRARRSVR